MLSNIYRAMESADLSLDDLQSLKEHIQSEILVKQARIRRVEYVAKPSQFMLNGDMANEFHGSMLDDEDEFDNYPGFDDSDEGYMG